MRRPSLVSKALPTSSLGTLGPLPLRLVFPLPRPLGRGLPLVSEGAAFGWSSCLRLLALLGLALGASLAGPLAASGSK